MQLHFLLYRSVATRKLDETCVRDILAKSIRNNARDGLSGFLHADRERFLQYIEGPGDALARRVVKIQKDRRHTGFKVLAEGAIDARFFPDWDMGYIEELAKLPKGVSERELWFAEDPDLDPLPLLAAFAAHAGAVEGLEIGETG